MRLMVKISHVNLFFLQSQSVAVKIERKKLIIFLCSPCVTLHVSKWSIYLKYNIVNCDYYLYENDVIILIHLNIKIFFFFWFECESVYPIEWTEVDYIYSSMAFRSMS